MGVDREFLGDDASRSDPSGVRAVDRAISILQAFTPERPSMSVVELQKQVGISRPTLYRLLQTLAAKGLVRGDGEPQRFALAHGVMQLSHVWLKGLNVIDVARPLLENIRDQTEETAAVFGLDGDRRICLFEAESRHGLAIIRGTGEVSSITRGATGRAILAYTSEEQRRRLLDSLDPSLGEQRLRELEGDYRETRRRGYATSTGELMVGAVAVAAPFFNHRGEVAGAIGVYGPAARIGADRIDMFGALVAEAAGDVSLRLGNPTGRTPPAADGDRRQGTRGARKRRSPQSRASVSP